MKKIQYTVGAPCGLHIRPATVLVKQAAEFPDCTIKVRKADREADGRRLLAVLSLGVQQHEHLEIIIEGDGEERAFHAFQSFCEENLAG